MSKVLQATYHKGKLVLDEELDIFLEGKKLTLILVEDNNFLEGADLAIANAQERKRQFLEKSNQYSAKLPPDYKFDREEAHER